MKSDVIILNSELEFRKYVIGNSKNIYKVFISEDILDETIFFYCLTSERNIIAAKEFKGNFISYCELYTEFAELLKLDTEVDFNKTKTLKLIKK